MITHSQQVEEMAFTLMLTWCLLVLFVASKTKIGNSFCNCFYSERLFLCLLFAAEKSYKLKLELFEGLFWFQYNY